MIAAAHIRLWQNCRAAHPKDVCYWGVIWTCCGHPVGVRANSVETIHYTLVRV